MVVHELASTVVVGKEGLCAVRMWTNHGDAERFLPVWDLERQQWRRHISITTGDNWFIFQQDDRLLRCFSDQLTMRFRVDHVQRNLLEAAKSRIHLPELEHGGQDPRQAGLDSAHRHAAVAYCRVERCFEQLAAVRVSSCVQCHTTRLTDIPLGVEVALEWLEVVVQPSRVAECGAVADDEAVELKLLPEHILLHVLVQAGRDPSNCIVGAHHPTNERRRRSPHGQVAL